MQTFKTFEEWKKLNPWISGVISPQFDFRAALKECWSAAKMGADVEIEVMRKSYEAMAASDFAMRKRVVELEDELGDLRRRMEALAAKLKRQARVDCDPANGSSEAHCRGRREAEIADELLSALDAPAGKGDKSHAEI